jgi:hypothetical protein
LSSRVVRVVEETAGQTTVVAAEVRVGSAQAQVYPLRQARTTQLPWAAAARVAQVRLLQKAQTAATLFFPPLPQPVAAAVAQ